jgi:hypothetical protein
MKKELYDNDKYSYMRHPSSKRAPRYMHLENEIEEEANTNANNGLPSIKEYD